MPAAIELHDAVVTDFRERAGDLTIHLAPAYLHRSTGRPGIDAGEVFSLDVEIRLRAVELGEPRIEIPQKLQTGSLSTRDAHHDNCLPFPLSVTGPIALELTNSRGGCLRLTAEGITVSPTSSETRVGAFPG